MKPIKEREGSEGSSGEFGDKVKNYGRMPTTDKGELIGYELYRVYRGKRGQITAFPARKNDPKLYLWKAAPALYEALKRAKDALLELGFSREEEDDNGMMVQIDDALRLAEQGR